MHPLYHSWWSTPSFESPIYPLPSEACTAYAYTVLAVLATYGEDAISTVLHRPISSETNPKTFEWTEGEEVVPRALPITTGCPELKKKPHRKVLKPVWKVSPSLWKERPSSEILALSEWKLLTRWLHRHHWTLTNHTHSKYPPDLPELHLPSKTSLANPPSTSLVFSKPDLKLRRLL